MQLFSVLFNSFMRLNMFKLKCLQLIAFDYDQFPAYIRHYTLYF